MYIFPKNSVTVLRKKGDEFVQESIVTESVLPSSEISAEQNRKNVIERLRKDPMVFLVMEPRNGQVDEEVLHTSGFSFHVTAREGEHPAATLRIMYKDSVVYSMDFAEEPGDDGVFDPVWSVLHDASQRLREIDNDDYYFVDPECPYFTRREKGEDVDLFNAPDLLSGAGFQTERLSVVGWVERPVLIVHENDMVVLGSRHFSGENLFLEMKRFFNFIDDDVVEKAVKKASETYCFVRVIHWEDGSWSFRTEIDDDVDTDNFIERMNEDIILLRKFIDLVVNCEGIGEEPWETLTEQRHYFIHEALEESLRLSKLKI